MLKQFFKLFFSKLNSKSSKSMLNKATDLYFQIKDIPLNIIIEQLKFMPKGKSFYYYSEKLKQVKDDYYKKNMNLSPQLKDIISKIGRKV